VAKVRIWAELDEKMLAAYEAEAGRRGVSVESLLEQTVKCLLAELEHEGTDDHAIFPC